MANISLKEIKDSLAEQLFDVKEKLSDDEYKNLIETTAEILKPKPRTENVSYCIVKKWKYGGHDTDVKVYKTMDELVEGMKHYEKEWLTKPVQKGEPIRESLEIQIFNRLSESDSEDED